MPHLIEDAKHAWKWLSVQALAVAGALPLVWVSIPQDWRDAVPRDWLAAASVAVSVIGIYGRVTVRKPKDDQQ